MAHSLFEQLRQWSKALQFFYAELLHSVVANT